MRRGRDLDQWRHGIPISSLAARDENDGPRHPSATLPSAGTSTWPLVSGFYHAHECGPLHPYTIWGRPGICRRPPHGAQSARPIADSLALVHQGGCR
jgi:hypothetical protein